MWYFNGNTYDLSKFANTHPGGKHLILETKNYDITYLVQCNHHWTKEYALERLEKYRIPDKNNKRQKIFWDKKLETIHKRLTIQN